MDSSVDMLFQSALFHVASARTLVEDAGAVLIGAGDPYVAGAAASICGFIDSVGMMISELPEIMGTDRETLEASAREYIARRQTEELNKPHV